MPYRMLRKRRDPRQGREHVRQRAGGGNGAENSDKLSRLKQRARLRGCAWERARGLSRGVWTSPREDRAPCRLLLRGMLSPRKKPRSAPLHSPLPAPRNLGQGRVIRLLINVPHRGACPVSIWRVNNLQ